MPVTCKRRTNSMSCRYRGDKMVCIERKGRTRCFQKQAGGDRCMRRNEDAVLCAECLLSVHLSSAPRTRHASRVADTYSPHLGSSYLKGYSGPCRSISCRGRSQRARPFLLCIRAEDHQGHSAIDCTWHLARGCVHPVVHWRPDRMEWSR